jgi:hypothetical protein
MAMRYCTPEGGSGYIPSSQVPTLSTFSMAQDAPVFDQSTAWLRDQRPSSYTNYSFMDLPPVNPGGPDPLFLRRADVVAPMPSMTENSLAANGGAGCEMPQFCASDVTTWIQNNPLLAAGLALVGAWALFGKKR